MDKKKKNSINNFQRSIIDLEARRVLWETNIGDGIIEWIDILDEWRCYNDVNFYIEKNYLKAWINEVFFTVLFLTW